MVEERKACSPHASLIEASQLRSLLIEDLSKRLDAHEERQDATLVRI